MNLKRARNLFKKMIERDKFKKPWNNTAEKNWGEKPY